MDIIILIILAIRISQKANAKGRSGCGYALLLVALWIGGLFFGIIAVAVATGGFNVGPNGEPPIECIVGGYACAIIGAIIAFTLVGKLSDLRHERDYRDEDDYEDYDSGRSQDRRRGRDDDYDRGDDRNRDYDDDRDNDRGRRRD